MKVKPIEKTVVAQHIIEQLVEMIGMGDLKAGDKLPSERELAESLQVSRPSLREAIRVLEVVGLVEIHPGSGTQITEMNIVPFLKIISSLLAKREGLDAELLRLRQILEEESASCAAASDPVLKEALLGPCISEMSVATNKNDIAQIGLSDIAFHKNLFILSGSGALRIAGEIINSTLEMLVQYKSKYKVGALQGLLEQHRTIYQSVIDGDAEAARLAMRNHLNFTKSYYLSEKQKKESGTA